MRIFKLTYGNPDSIKFPSCHIDFDNPWSDEDFTIGKYIDDIHNLPIRYEVDNKYPLYDYPYCANGFLASNKLTEVVKKLMTNIQIFPSEIYQKNQKVSDNFNTIVFTTLYSVLNWEYSECKESKEIPGLAEDIKRLVFSKDKLCQVPSSEKIFLPFEDTVTILVTEEGKNEIEKAGIHGVLFEEMEIV